MHLNRKLNFYLENCSSLMEYCTVKMQSQFAFYILLTLKAQHLIRENATLFWDVVPFNLKKVMFYLKTIVSDTVPQIAEEEMKMC